MNTYNCYHNRKVYEVKAATSYAAQKAVAAAHNIKRPWDITVILVAKGTPDGDQAVIHSTAELN